MTNIPESLQYFVYVLVSALAIGVNWRMIQLQISRNFLEFENKNENDHKKLFEALHKHQEILEKTTATLDIYESNRIFFKSIDETIMNAGITYLKDDKDALGFLTGCSKAIISFSKEMLEIRTRVAKDGYISSRAAFYISSCRELCRNKLGSDFFQKFQGSSNHITKQYIIDIGKISDDWVNDKRKRFISITRVYVEMLVTSFVKAYFKEFKQDV